MKHFHEVSTPRHLFGDRYFAKLVYYNCTPPMHNNRGNNEAVNSRNTRHRAPKIHTQKTDAPKLMFQKLTSAQNQCMPIAS